MDTERDEETPEGLNERMKERVKELEKKVAEMIMTTQIKNAEDEIQRILDRNNLVYVPTITMRLVPKG